jgi:nitroreductase
MKQKLIRRNFFKKSLLATLGILFFKNQAQAKLTIGQSSIIPGNETEPQNETIKTIQDLRTTHGNFSKKEISQDLLEQIKESCIRSANSSNMQTYSIVVVKDRNLMQQLCGYQGSCMMLFCIDFNRLIAGANSLGLPYFPDNMTNLLTASINTSVAAQTATIAARSLGIDSLLTNGIHRGDMERLWKLLNLPEKYCMPLIALVLGYADQKASYRTGRLSGKSIFHEKQYQLLTREELTEIIGKYDNSELHLGLNDGWRENGYKHYLEWLHKEWLKENAKPSESETQLFVQLKKRGFVELQGTAKL